MPVRMEETADLFRCKIVNSKTIWQSPRVVGLLLGQGRQSVVRRHSNFVSNDCLTMFLWLSMKKYGQVDVDRWAFGC